MSSACWTWVVSRSAIIPHLASLTDVIEARVAFEEDEAIAVPVSRVLLE